MRYLPAFSRLSLFGKPLSGVLPKLSMLPPWKAPLLQHAQAQNEAPAGLTSETRELVDGNWKTACAIFYTAGAGGVVIVVVFLSACLVYWRRQRWILAGDQDRH